jgi:hypothetical protein
MKKANVFKLTGFGLLAMVLVGVGVSVFRTNTSSSRVVLTDEFDANRKILHSAAGDHACDCFSPIIANFKVSNVTTNSADFSWDCSSPSSYQVNYGTSGNKGTKFPKDRPDVSYTNHTVTVTGLNPNTEYHAGPTSVCLSNCTRNSVGGLVKEFQQSNGQRDWTFKTNIARMDFHISGFIKDAGKGMEGVTVKLSGDSSRTVTTTSTGEYKFTSLPKTGTFTVTPTKTGYTYNPPSLTYANSTGDQTDKNYTAAVVGVVAQAASCVISDFEVAKITAKDVTIAWKTDAPAMSLVEYGLTTDYGLKTGVNTEMVKNHEIQLFNLREGATYHCRAISYTGESAGIAKTTAHSSDFTFKTPAFEDRIASKENIFNEPNPCSQWTNISYMLYQPVKRVTIDILSLSGKLVASLESPASARAEGWNKVRWDVTDNTGKPLVNGIYVYKMTFQTATNNVMVVKSSTLRVAR